MLTPPKRAAYLVMLLTHILCAHRHIYDKKGFSNVILLDFCALYQLSREYISKQLKCLLFLDFLLVFASIMFHVFLILLTNISCANTHIYDKNTICNVILLDLHFRI